MHDDIMRKVIDKIDIQILQELEVNARASIAEIGKSVGLSGPATGERVRRLQDAGIIRSFTVLIDQTALGYTLEAIVRIKPRPGFLHIVEKMIVDEPRFTNCDKVTGEDCFIARLALMSVSELDDLLLPMHERAETHTSIVKSSLLRNRPPDLNPS